MKLPPPKKLARQVTQPDQSNLQEVCFERFDTNQNNQTELQDLPNSERNERDKGDRNSEIIAPKLRISVLSVAAVGCLVGLVVVCFIVDRGNLNQDLSIISNLSTIFTNCIILLVSLCK